MKKWRYIGFDDGFSSFRDEKAYLVGCITTGTSVEGFLFTTIEVDGFDVTSKIIDLILKSRFREQLKCIFLSGITFGGFNIADVDEINRKTGIPVVVTMKKPPDLSLIGEALQNVSEVERRMEIIKKAGEIYGTRGIYIQFRGCSLGEAERFIESSKVGSKIPEPLRIAHLVASSLVYGESTKT
ncbi:MAG TPA: DUF99 family protein [Archaeoglobaceae archaeon]|nr:DUF99 family protein [Archaeoglobaceae archaeon]